MGEQYDSGAWRDSALETGEDLSRGRIGGREGHLRVDNSIAMDALLPCVPHRPIILAGTQHLVTAAEVEAELDDLECFGGTPRQGEFLRVAAKQSRRAPSHILPPRVRSTLGPMSPIERSTIRAHGLALQRPEHRAAAPLAHDQAARPSWGASRPPGPL